MFEARSQTRFLYPYLTQLLCPERNDLQWTKRRPASERVPESLNCLQNRLTSPLSLVCDIKPHRKYRNNADNKQMTSNTDPNSSRISRRLILSHNVASSNPASAIEHSDNCGSERAFPLSGNIVLIVRRQCRPVANIGACGEEYADVPNGDLVCEAEHAEAHNQADAIESYYWTAEAVPVAYYRGNDDRDHGIVIWW